MPRRALITGITGQDGYYLAELLLAKGYQVYGTVRQPLPQAASWLGPIGQRVALHQVDLLDQAALTQLLETVAPHEFYNLAAQSFVPASFDNPVETGQINGVAVESMLQAVRTVDPAIHFFQASTAEIFGPEALPPQSERTPLCPRSPYAAAKAQAHQTTIAYRENSDLFACSGILFSHESPRRDPQFVVRKVTSAAARIKLGLQSKLELGNLDVQRDWGYAGDYVDAMWRMLQREKADDFVIATGQKHTVRELVELAFSLVELEWSRYVAVDPQLFRPADALVRCGDASKARQQLGWQPKVSFSELVTMMVETDLRHWTAEPGRP